MIKNDKNPKKVIITPSSACAAQEDATKLLREVGLVFGIQSMSNE